MYPSRQLFMQSRHPRGMQRVYSHLITMSGERLCFFQNSGIIFEGIPNNH